MSFQCVWVSLKNDSLLQTESGFISETFTVNTKMCTSRLWKQFFLFVQNRRSQQSLITAQMQKGSGVMGSVSDLLSVDACQSWFEPRQRLPLFPWTRNFILIAKYWLVTGKDSSVIYRSKKFLFHNRTKINEYKLKGLYLHLYSIAVRQFFFPLIPYNTHIDHDFMLCRSRSCQFTMSVNIVYWRVYKSGTR